MRREIALLAAVFLAAFGLNTRHNGFPWHYHPDEPGKVLQVQTGEYNFNHPLLLLGGARLVAEARGVNLGDPQAVVEAGRTVSAAYGAAAVALLALLAMRLFGWVAGWISGGVLALHHQVYELSHYMKEDTALLFGVALAFVAVERYGRQPGGWAALVLGAACGIAASGKYVGAAMLLPAMGAVLCARRGKACGDAGTVLAGAVLVFAAMNIPLLAGMEVFRASLGKEVGYVVAGQKGMTQSVPHNEYLSAFRDNTTPALWAGIALAYWTAWRMRGRVRYAGWLALGFPVVFALLLSFSPKANDRYFLPATGLFCVVAAWGLAGIASDVRRRWGWRAALTVPALALAAQIWSLPEPLDWKAWLEYDLAFRHDDRAELRVWMKENIEPDAMIAADPRAGLPETGDKQDAARLVPVSQTVLGGKSAASAGTLAELRDRGVSHIIVSESDYGRYFRSRLKPKAGFEGEYARYRAFYEEVFLQGEKVWERKRGTVIYLHPGIEVFRLR